MQGLNKESSKNEGSQKGNEDPKQDNQGPKIVLNGLKQHNSAQSEAKNTTEINTSKSSSKTVVVCAINEEELNKVEYAFFKRPQPPINAPLILSDK